ncbi:MAG: TIGR03619 family F420-dependent LLM class oxidoreductase [Thermoprotei archaeon]
MEFGLCLPNYGETSTPHGLVEFAKEAEDLGFSSLWATDHLLMSANSNTPYEWMFESITTLAYVAALTRRVKLGVSSLVMGLRNPVVVAKQLATLDQLTGGRVILATGAGWYAREFENLGMDYHTRGRRLDESLRLIAELWYTKGPLSFYGRHLPHKIREGVFEPKPAQPHIEVFVAGNSMAAIRRSLKYADGWHPNLYPLSVFSKLVKEYRALEGSATKKIVVRVGYDATRSEVEYTSPQGERRVLLSGDLEKNARLIAELESLGVSGMVLAPNYNGRVSVDDQLKAIRLFASRFL